MTWIAQHRRFHQVDQPGKQRLTAFYRKVLEHDEAVHEGESLGHTRQVVVTQDQLGVRDAPRRQVDPGLFQHGRGHVDPDDPVRTFGERHKHPPHTAPEVEHRPRFEARGDPLGHGQHGVHIGASGPEELRHCLVVEVDAAIAVVGEHRVVRLLDGELLPVGVGISVPGGDAVDPPFSPT